ncbi:CapA family protein, partial [Anaerosporobacter sp.]|uniref:CapA family protein n=1 Tax=Anaerosporobacter sp. TaxID=1872529 RepID=UPI00286EF231
MLQEESKRGRPVKRSRLYKLLLFDVIALAVIFVAVVYVYLNSSFAPQSNNSIDEPELLFTQSFAQKMETSLNESLRFLSVSNDEIPTEELQQEVVTRKPILMEVTGDVLFSASPLNKYDSGNGITSILSTDLLEKMNSADITMVNLEFPFSTRGTQMENKQYTFRADPARCSILKEMGVDIVSLANNHILDFGT